MTDRIEDLERNLTRALDRPGLGSSDFDLNPDFKLPEGRKLRPAGVLCAITVFGGAPHVLLTKRSSALKHHPGQIAFPGGKQEEGDADPTAAALREANEEIGLSPNLVSVLGVLPTHETVTGFDVTPVVGIVRSDFDIRLDPSEVDEVFSVPLQHLVDPGRFVVQSRRWRGVQRHYYVVPFGPYYIWGATARILRGLAARVSE